ncbi:MAG: hypothetical protein KGH80_10370, partial [Xanthomonadaceae bacterium]|nr:hypothetical protein [Xanthomonadaceae bacterium]
ETVAASSFTFVEHWQKSNADDADAVLAFWRRENAIGDEASAKKRLDEIVVHACDANGAVAGVCTAVPITLPRLGQPTYYYRCFIGAQWRKSRLVLGMLKKAGEVLESYACEHGFPCIGIVLELENSRFGQTMQNAVWPSTGFVYIGKSQRGLDLRVKYFRGAKLKPTKI